MTEVVWGGSSIMQSQEGQIKGIPQGKRACARMRPRSEEDQCPAKQKRQVIIIFPPTQCINC